MARRRRRRPQLRVVGLCAVASWSTACAVPPAMPAPPVTHPASPAGARAVVFELADTLEVRLVVESPGRARGDGPPGFEADR